MRPRNNRARTRQQTSKPISLPPPTGGWNARDALPSMQPNDALLLDNVIPDVGNVRSRPGFQPWATGLGSAIESLMEYAPASGANKLFAATATAIYDATARGAVGAAALSSLSNGRWQHTMFSSAAVPYLFCANGADGIRSYNGTAWATPSITGTGFTAANIVGVNAYQNRLWFVENNALHVWYLDVLSIAGTAVKFDIGPICKKGGFILAMATLSRDGGAGPDDLAVFITNKGEVLIYLISDPTTASGISLQGVFNIAEPIGRRCVVRAGNDIAILTSQGLLPLTSVLATNIASETNSAITNKILSAFRGAYADAGSNFGWQVVEFPKRNLFLVNVPYIERTLQKQFVVNATTGAWARFSGLNGGCWSLKGDQMFFGGNDGVVYQFGEVSSDNGQPILCQTLSAYALGGPQQQDQRLKRFVMARAYTTGPADFRPAVQLFFDYEIPVLLTPQNLPPVGNQSGLGAVWDQAVWDVADWGAVPAAGLAWQVVRGSGVTVAVAISALTLEEIVLNGVDLLYEPGGLPST